MQENSANTAGRGWGGSGAVDERQLLQCVVEVARSVFSAAAASVFMIDHETGDLVFEAVAGEGETKLIGTRFPEGTGIVGWVAACGQPLLTDNVEESDQFARDAAEETGYVPRTIAAVPLFHDDVCVGVLEVLDRQTTHGELQVMDLLGLLANQAAAGLVLIRRLRQLTDRRERTGGDGARNATTIERIAAGVPHMNPDEALMLSRVLALADDIAEAAMSRTHQA